MDELPTIGIGFRHLIEDGLSIVSGCNTVISKRRTYVLGDLTDLFTKAAKGADLKKESSLFVDHAKMQAVKEFMFLRRYIDNENNNEFLVEKLRITKEVLECFLQGEHIMFAKSFVAIAVLDEILSTIERMNRIGTPPQLKIVSL